MKALLPVLVVAAACTMPVRDAPAREPCSGHQLLKTPRPEASCLDVAPRVFVSPDKELRAVVLPVDVSLYATPDSGELRVVIRTRAGDTITAKDYSSPRGANGLYVVEGKSVSRFTILRLQHVLFGRAFAVVVSGHGL